MSSIQVNEGRLLHIVGEAEQPRATSLENEMNEYFSKQEKDNVFFSVIGYRFELNESDWKTVTEKFPNDPANTTHEIVGDGFFDVVRDCLQTTKSFSEKGEGWSVWRNFPTRNSEYVEFYVGLQYGDTNTVKDGLQMEAVMLDRLIYYSVYLRSKMAAFMHAMQEMSAKNGIFDLSSRIKNGGHIVVQNVQLGDKVFFNHSVTDEQKECRYDDRHVIDYDLFGGSFWH